MRQSRQATKKARALRRTMTEAEAKLWRHLRGGQVGRKFRRQGPIGPFIADFCCREVNLVVEVDGGQHAEAAGRDAMRTRFLSTYGYAVLRFWNHEVLSNLEGVLATIVREVALRMPDPLLVPSQVTLTLPSPTRKKRVGEGT